MEENKFDQPYLFATFSQPMVVDEEQNVHDTQDFNQFPDNFEFQSSNGDSGFDELRATNFFDEHQEMASNNLPRANQLLRKLISSEYKTPAAKSKDSEELDEQQHQVIEFFNKGTTQSIDKNR
jgi:hypothetical protein